MLSSAINIARTYPAILSEKGADHCRHRHPGHGLLWPWLSKLPLRRLPGDIVIQREVFRFYLPLTTGILVSLVLTLIVWLSRR